MGAIASQITSLMIVYSIVYTDPDQRKHQSSASLAFVRGIHKWPVARKMFPFDDVIMLWTHISPDGLGFGSDTERSWIALPYVLHTPVKKSYFSALNLIHILNCRHAILGIHWKIKFWTTKQNVHDVDFTTIIWYAGTPRLWLYFSVKFKLYPNNNLCNLCQLLLHDNRMLFYRYVTFLRTYDATYGK